MDKDQKEIMADKYFFDVRDSKWARPDVREHWIFELGIMSEIYDPLVPIEKKREILNSLDTSAWVQNANEPECKVTVAHYDVPGCPEEPETSAHVIVYTPENLADKEKNRTMFYCIGGGMVTVVPEMFGLDGIAAKHKCVVVTCIHRSSVYAKWPASINDCHAAFEWMIQNAKILKIDTDNIILHGASSGGTLATALPFRLMRYGHKNIRGIVVNIPQTDDRAIHSSTRLMAYGLNGQTARQIHQLWMGVNYASNLTGPEGFANHASTEECIGYPPTFIHTFEFDPDRDATNEFARKLQQVGTFCELHIWGGLQHGFDDACWASPVGKRLQNMLDENIEELFEQDLRRPWITK